MNKDKLEVAKWLLDKNLGWIAVADAKVAVVITADIGMFGGLAAAYGSIKSSSAWLILFSALACFFLLCSMFAAAKALHPQLEGPKRSLIFFRKISELSEFDYKESMKTVSNMEFLDDALDQVYRNAQIATQKHSAVRIAMNFSFLAIIPWVCAVWNAILR